jgi:alpha-tubulin suppressor-like RCC1 family protein
MLRRTMTALSVLAMVGCVGGQGGEATMSGDETTGSISAAVTRWPVGIRCIRLTLAGATNGVRDWGWAHLDQDIGVSSFSTGPLAPGELTVTASAFAGNCDLSDPAWISDPVSTKVIAGMVTSLTLTLRPNVPANPVTLDFAQPALAVVAGSDATYGLLQNGTVRGWGANDVGQLANGANVTRTTPGDLLDQFALPLTGITQLSAASNGQHACGLRGSETDGGVLYCWGSNTYGQVGYGGHAPGLSYYQYAVKLALSFDQVSAGSQHTCALGHDAFVYCWGLNSSGQLGDGTTINRDYPTRVVGLPGQVVEVRAGDTFSCARMANGSVYCWGGNANGQLGVNSVTGSTTPVLTRFNPVAELASGSAFECALYPSGAVGCAGKNVFGNLGDGTVMQRLIPTTVTGLSNVVDLVAGDSHACAAKSDGTLSCWGSNSAGQLGDGTATNRLVPVAVRGLTSVTSVTAGAQHSCARKTEGSIWCWGANNKGQLGDGTSIYRFVPTRVSL